VYVGENGVIIDNVDLSKAVKVETVIDGIIPDKYYLFPNNGMHYFSQIPETHNIGIYREKIWPHLVCVVDGSIHYRHQFGSLDGKGYVVVRLDKDTQRRPTYYKSRKKIRYFYQQTYTMMHRLVAATFIPNYNPKEQTQVHHKNDVKFDYRIENLDWVSHKENSIHGSKGKKVDPLERWNYYSKKDWFKQEGF
tara:strand:- start:1205 stop:1783 length:579 start_codon:yes stop_codon:yes gene_type:complete